MKNLSEWAFQLTFIGVGLRTSFRDMVRTGVKPLVVGVAAEAAVAGVHARHGVRRGRLPADAVELTGPSFQRRAAARAGRRRLRLP